MTLKKSWSGFYIMPRSLIVGEIFLWELGVPILIILRAVFLARPQPTIVCIA